MRIMFLKKDYKAQCAAAHLDANAYRHVESTFTGCGYILIYYNQAVGSYCYQRRKNKVAITQTLDLTDTCAIKRDFSRKTNKQDDQRQGLAINLAEKMVQVAALASKAARCGIVNNQSVWVKK